MNESLLPDYTGGGIVNLMASITSALGRQTRSYEPVAEVEALGLGRARNVVLLVIDGLGYETLVRHGRSGALHNALARTLTSVFPSTTASAVTTFLTGLAPQQHALTGWFMYFEEIGALATPLPFKPRGNGALLTELGTRPKDLFSHTPMFNGLQRRSYSVCPNRISDTPFNRFHAGVAKRRGYGSLSDFFASIVDAVREADSPAFVYAYYPEIDAHGHEYGIDSPETKRHFELFDNGFSQLANALAGTETVIIATADHGFVDTSPGDRIALDDHPQLADTLALPLCGEPRVVYCYVKPGMEREFERYAATQFSKYAVLERSETLLRNGYFGPGTPHPRLHGRIGDYTLLMRNNYILKDWVPGERPHSLVGVHGGLSASEMTVPLCIVQA